MSAPDIQRRLLQAIEDNPYATQANMAAQIGVAVGSVNWYLKRLIHKGYVKVTQLQRRSLSYALTPQGLALKTRLTARYLELSLRLFRELRQEARGALADITKAGYRAVHLEGDSDAVEIFRLTCLEQGVRVVTGSRVELPTVRLEGTGFALDWPEQESRDGGAP